MKKFFNFKKPAFWIVIVAVIACIITAVCLLTNPPQGNKQPDTPSGQESLQYKVADILFENTAFSFSETADNAPQYYISDGKLMWNVSNEGENKQSTWTQIGTLNSTEINKADFEAMLENGEWYVTDFADFYSQIVSVKKAETVHLGVKQFFLVLQLKDSSVVLCRGFYDDTDTPYIRWVQGLEQISISSIGGEDGSTDVNTQPSNTFDATILEKNEKSILVQPADGSAELKSADKISVALDSPDSDAFAEVKVGDKVRITYDGIIAESYPAQINTVYSVCRFNENGDISYIIALPSGDIRRCYTYNSSVEPVIKPTILLSDKGNRFQFTYSAFSSYFAVGSYELTDDKLTLKTDDGNNTYVFSVEGSTFVFDASQSSEIPKYAYESGAQAECPVPDGAVFSIQKQNKSYPVRGTLRSVTG